MTKSPFPLVDVIMLGPLLAYLNLYLGRPLPEYYVAIGLMVSATPLYHFVIFVYTDLQYSGYFNDERVTVPRYCSIFRSLSVFNSIPLKD